MTRSQALLREHATRPEIALRPPSTIMRLERMGSFFPTRLSFLRSLLRDMAAEGACVDRLVFELDDNGFGEAAYQVHLRGRAYTLIAYTSPLDEDARTDRVIAEAWDACFVLFDGIPKKKDIDELRQQATRQEAGRFNDRVLVLSRANKSVRLFEHVLEALADGNQPDGKALADIGYLMRTTAVYGNGKFGLADRAHVLRRGGPSEPFRLEMLTVWLIREFTFDLVDHIARKRGGSGAVALAAPLRCQLGIGNSTGLGMAPFLVEHPQLINNWMLARETALARVRAVQLASASMREATLRCTDQISRHLSAWSTEDARAQARIDALRHEWKRFAFQVGRTLAVERPFDALVRASERGSSDLQELVVALVLEPNGALVDGLSHCMDANEGFLLDPSMPVGTLRSFLKSHYAWCEAFDVQLASSKAMVWYVSEEKFEPRLGERREGANDNCEMLHGVAHAITELNADLTGWGSEILVAEFLARHPQHRNAVRRVQLVARYPYGEIRDNLLDAGVRPIDLLRCKLSFFGASRFDPRSDRWTRITLFAGAPCAADLTPQTAEDCFLPSFDQAM
ncbi:MAG: hypothetical protein OXR62_00090 [Ahrensia sp.]|nr:hypothetical protein [Ahrensia sp.]